MGGENQGLQIALIILFMLVVLLAVATFSFFTTSTGLTQQVADLTKERDAARGVEQKLTQNVYKLKEWIGLDPSAQDDDLTTATQAYTEDIAKFAGSLPAEKQKYRFALEQVYSDLSIDKDKITQLSEQVKMMETVNKAFEEASKKQVDEALAAKKKAEDDLAGEVQKFADAQRKSEDEKKDLLAKVDTLQKQLAESEELAKTAGDAPKAELAKATKQLDVARETITQLRGESDIADDGEVRHVNARARLVWINLGRADGLRPQTLFTVHAADVPPTSPNATKAKIQVSQILGDHMAEARVLEDNLTNPLIPGDKIYTALWDPGRVERFYLAGRMNVTPGTDGLAEIRSMIAISGGQIDGELNEKGDQTGTLTAETRYLVLGENSVQAKAKYDQLVADAKLLGVEAIGIDKFLDHVGFKSAPSGLRFGPSRNVNDAAPELPDGGVPATTNTAIDQFKKRRPQPAMTGSDSGRTPSAYYKLTP